MNKEELKKRSGEHLKKLLDVYGLKQVDLTELPKPWGEDGYFTPSEISRYVSGKMTMTQNVAEFFIESYFPRTRVQYLLGIDDYMTEGDVTMSIVNTAQREGETMFCGLNLFAELNGYSIKHLEFMQESPPVLDVIAGLKEWYHVCKDGKLIAKLSIEEMNKLENEICDFVEFKLSKLKGD